MNEKVLKELIKTRNVLKKKFRSIKLGEADTLQHLKDTFKPITEPLKDFIINSKNIKGNLKTEKNNFSFNDVPKNLKTSTPKKLVEPGFSNKSDSCNDDDDDDFFSQSETLNSSNVRESYPDLSLLKSKNELDLLYGAHKDSNNEWKFGDSTIKFNGDKIVVGNQIWALTPGLFSLMFHKQPRNYDKYELDIYKNILIKTNAHKRDYQSDGQIKGTRAYKYKNIIRKLFKTESQNDSSILPTPTTKSKYVGDGMMKLNLNRTNYIYWDDPNELVDRLRLLLASQAAGHSNHNNEIVSIIEELYEANIIEY